MRMIVYTADIRFHDHLRAPAVVSPNVEYICFSDRRFDAPPPWKVVPTMSALFTDDPHRLVRVYKLMPHLWFPDADVWIWHDANLSLRVTPEQLVNDYLEPEADMALFKHPCRTCLYKESEIVVREGIEDGNIIAAQLRRYDEAKMPREHGLYCGGFHIRRNTSKVRYFNETWWYEVLHWSGRDQISLPFALWMNQLNGVILPGASVYDAPAIVGWEPHADFKSKHTAEDNAKKAEYDALYWGVKSRCARKVDYHGKPYPVSK